jgi:hypothetical protein
MLTTGFCYIMTRISNVSNETRSTWARSTSCLESLSQVSYKESGTYLPVAHFLSKLQTCEIRSRCTGRPTRKLTVFIYGGPITPGPYENSVIRQNRKDEKDGKVVANHVFTISSVENLYPGRTVTVLHSLHYHIISDFIMTSISHLRAAHPLTRTQIVRNANKIFLHPWTKGFSNVILTPR